MKPSFPCAMVMPNPDVARIGYGLAREFSHAMTVGPMTLGLRRSAHAVDRTISVRGLLNMARKGVVNCSKKGGGGEKGAGGL